MPKLKTESIEIDYYIDDQSFDYIGQSGRVLTHRDSRPEAVVEVINLWVDAIDDFIDVSKDSKMIGLAQSMVEEYLNNKGES